MEKIRSLITDYNNKYAISKDGDLWNKLCSSMDVVEDAELAIRAYKQGKYPHAEGVKYLYLYGLLQALYVQQLALNGMCEALRLPCILGNPILKRIRIDRNDSIGHPTNRSTGLYHYIIRVSITKNGFELLSFDKNNKSSHRHIIVNELIMQQKKAVMGVLKKVKAKILKDLKKIA